MDDLFPRATASSGHSAPIDIDALLAPIPGQSATGVDLREDAKATSVYYRLRECRTTARNNERAALANGDTDFINPPDWYEILELVPSLLQNETKDLEITAWLIEALTRTAGFAGVAAGFTLARRLIEDFGTALYPLPDEDGVATQLAALTGLNGFGSEGALISPLKSIPLTEGAPPAPFSAWQCEQAFDTGRIGDEARRAARSKRGFVQPAEVEQAVAETPPAFFSALNASLEAAMAAFKAYESCVDSYSAESPQPTARIGETLAAVHQLLRHIAGDRLVMPVAEITAEEAPDSAQTAAPAASSAPINERAAALRQLREVAAFFRRTEPHSPISYAVEQAVYWSELSLPELIGELIPDDNAREKFRTLAGIRAPK